MHCYLVTDDCASMGRRRAERSRESERQWQAERETCHSIPTITVGSMRRHTAAHFISSALHRHKMMVLFYESLQMEKGAAV